MKCAQETTYFAFINGIDMGSHSILFKTKLSLWSQRKISIPTWLWCDEKGTSMLH